MKVRAHQYDTVDALCWRHYGRTQGVTEQVLKANPGLAEYGPFLPHGLQVELPDIPTTTTVQTVQLSAGPRSRRKSRKRSRAITWWVRMKTCWYLIALMPTGATPNGQRKCSGNACNAALRHSRYNWRKGGQISTRKCQ